MRNLNALANVKKQLISAKAHILIFLVFFALCQGYGQNDSTARDYIPFPTANAVWRECNYNAFELQHEEDYQYIITGDSLISEKTYHKLQRTGYVRLWDDFHRYNYYSYSINEYAGCYRNDTIEKKVWYVFPDDNTEQLLYDFNLQIGDTLPVKFGYPFGIGIITNIDAIVLDDGLHKRFEVFREFYGDFYIIEGVGSTIGLILNIPPPGVIDPFDIILRCFSINGNPIYMNPIPGLANCDTAYLDIKNYHQNKIGISLYPNPVNEQLTVKCNDLNITHIQIIDVTGRAIIDVIPKNDEQEIILDVRSLPAGLYFIKATIDKQSVVRKIVKY
jgi:hypothetical protein